MQPVSGTSKCKPRLAASTYLNTAPLVWGFQHGSKRDDVELILQASPAICTAMLADGAVDVAVAPIIEYQRIPDAVLVSGVCVGARSDVASVLLATRSSDLREVRTLALDSSSRTSAALVQVIFREFLGIEPRMVPSSPDIGEALQRSDAALIIGDPALTLNREGLQVFDLAGLWRHYTGTGFVFAMWMARENRYELLFGIDFAAARDEALEHIEEIAAEYEKRLKLPRFALVSYLRENLCFEVTQELLEGLQLFFQMAQKHGVVESVRPLRFLA